MCSAIAHVVTGEVTTAIRDSHLNGLTIRQGQYIGLLEGDLVVVDDDIPTVIVDLLRRAIDDDHEIVTLYYGSGVAEAQAQSLVETLEQTFTGLDFEMVPGGQPLYPYIFSVE